MNNDISAPPLSCSTVNLAKDIKEQSVQDGIEKVHYRSTPNLIGAGHPRGESESKKRRVSLPEAVQHLTLAESSASQCEPATPAMDTTVAAQSCRPERTDLKTALGNLCNNALSPADFVVLVNEFGYCAPLDKFPVEVLHPFHWLAIRQRVCQQILRWHPSLLAKLPALMITCDICLNAHRGLKGAMFSLVPDHLKDSFFTKLVESYPREVLNIPPIERTFERLLTACSAEREILDALSDEQRTVALVAQVVQRTGYGLQYLAKEQRSYGLCLRACAVNGAALEHVPNEFKDKNLCRAALSQCGLAYRWLPEELSKDKKMQLLACQKEGAALQWIAKEQHNRELLEAACQSHPIALTLIEKDKITPEMCRLACSNNASAAAPHIPEDLLDETLCWQICSTTDDPQQCQHFMPKTANDYKRLLNENDWATLAWVPEEYRNAEHYLLACQNRGVDLSLIHI